MVATTLKKFEVSRPLYSDGSIIMFICLVSFVHKLKLSMSLLRDIMNNQAYVPF